MNTHTLQTARECGCPNPSPAQIKAFEEICQQGIREARNAHMLRRLVTDAVKLEPGLISAMMRPAQSIDEALEDVSAAIARYRNMPTWRREYYAPAVRRAKTNRIYFRFFRRFGAQIMAREAA